MHHELYKPWIRKSKTFNTKPSTVDPLEPFCTTLPLWLCHLNRLRFDLGRVPNTLRIGITFNILE